MNRMKIAIAGAAETDLGAVIAHIDSVKPELLIIDSVQTIGSAAGSDIFIPPTVAA